MTISSTGRSCGTRSRRRRCKFGDEVAILLGDFLYVEGFSLLASLNDPQLVDLFARATRTVCQGEINQVRRRFQLDLSLAEYLSFIDNKTATLMGAAMRGGARLARLSTDQATLSGITAGTWAWPSRSSMTRWI